MVFVPPDGLLPPASSAEEIAQEDSSTPPYLCPEMGCGERFPRKCDLTKHRRNHDRPVHCPIQSCEVKKSQNKDLYRHIWTCHKKYAEDNNIPKEQDTCMTCGSVGRRDNVKRHRELYGHE
ncbi:hypothetical protein GQ53DRAFT_330020 [Thozetella sp. PMI_491]|nr:hypothetical protein GQ53DRAFT_330020 [Thozetella sp. PMI_491]